MLSGVVGEGVAIFGYSDVVDHVAPCVIVTNTIAIGINPLRWVTGEHIIQIGPTITI